MIDMVRFPPVATGSPVAGKCSLATPFTTIGEAARDLLGLGWIRRSTNRLTAARRSVPGAPAQPPSTDLAALLCRHVAEVEQQAQHPRRLFFVVGADERRERDDTRGGHDHQRAREDVPSLGSPALRTAALAGVSLAAAMSVTRDRRARAATPARAQRPSARSPRPTPASSLLVRARAARRRERAPRAARRAPAARKVTAASGAPRARAIAAARRGSIGRPLPDASCSRRRRPARAAPRGRTGVPRRA
jgi:hypothetical protein